MIGLKYLKVAPTTHVIHYVNGRLKKQGPGLSFIYFAPFSEIVLVSMVATDQPFIFNEMTADFQEVSIQGQVTYRVIEPARLAGMLDFSVDERQLYRTDDPSKVAERITNAAQILARSFTQKRTLRDVLVNSESLVTMVRDGIRESNVTRELGIEVTEFHIVAIKATPEMARALQADAREELLKKADEAIFVRRNAVVDMERSIRENELNTEILVQQKQREVKETQLKAEIALEEQRAILVDNRVANERKEAESKAFALSATLEPLKGIDWRILMAAAGGGDAEQNIGVAFRELAENATKIGEFNISPDLLASLIKKK